MAGSSRSSTDRRPPRRCSPRRSRRLRAAGLSGSKTASILDLATRVVEGEVKLDRIARLSDDEIVRELTLVRGIGRWTAEMFLIFQLGRLDVWPVDDFGVRKGYGRLYGLGRRRHPRCSSRWASSSARSVPSRRGIAGARPTPRCQPRTHATRRPSKKSR